MQSRAESLEIIAGVVGTEGHSLGGSGLGLGDGMTEKEEEKESCTGNESKLHVVESSSLVLVSVISSTETH